MTTDGITGRLLERIREALAAEYDVEEPLGVGGMGLVLRGRQRRLDRPVAIKILRPEHATAIATARFLTEARLLARLSHPNVVTVFDAGESDGLLYYVMEYVPGETLAHRLQQGPLTPAELENLAGDLLRGLEAAHRIGVIHRDLKPSNIFLREGRALLGDFGLARATGDADPTLTTPGGVIGTPRYMPPEQQSGQELTARTDVYAAGMVLFEAATRTVWPTGLNPELAGLSGVPPHLAVPLRRALALDPAGRFPDAAAFRAALERRPLRPVARALYAVGLLGAVAVVWATRKAGSPGEAPGGGLHLAVAPFDAGGTREERALGDSLAVAVVASLSGYLDFHPELTRAEAAPAALRVHGLAATVGDSIRLTILPRATASWRVPPVGPISGLRREWPRVADSLAVALARALWEQQADALGLGATLPRSGAGFARWFSAEQLWARARWEAAGQAYALAEQQDSTCLLCSWRLMDIGRWLGQDRDEGRLARVLRRIDAFPPHYRALIRAASAPLPQRIDLLQQAVRQYPDFFLASFELADELMHRGPLHGRLRSDAGAPLLRAVQLRPGFGPALEHYAYLLIWEGDTARARSALEALGQVPSASGFTAAFRTFLTLAYDWRFQSGERARGLTQATLERAELRNNPLTATGARMMMTAQVPRGAVALGAMLASVRENPEFIREGLLGELYGSAALGRLDSVRRVGARLARQDDPSLPLLALELEALLRAFDPDASVRADPVLPGELKRYLAAGASPPALRHRAALAAGLLSARTGQLAGLDEAWGALADEPEPRVLGRLLGAVRARDRDSGSAALAALPPPEALADPLAGPVADAAARLLRAEWLLEAGQRDSARRVLRWHEHLDVPRHGGGDPYPGEIAWAAGTLAAWSRAQLLAAEANPGPGQTERCAVFRMVADGWAGAPAPFGPRADSARAQARGPGCAGPP